MKTLKTLAARTVAMAALMALCSGLVALGVVYGGVVGGLVMVVPCCCLSSALLR